MRLIGEWLRHSYAFGKFLAEQLSWNGQLSKILGCSTWSLDSRPRTSPPDAGSIGYWPTKAEYLSKICFQMKEVVSPKFSFPQPWGSPHPMTAHSGSINTNQFPFCQLKSTLKGYLSSWVHQGFNSRYRHLHLSSNPPSGHLCFPHPLTGFVTESTP